MAINSYFSPKRLKFLALSVSILILAMIGNFAGYMLAPKPETAKSVISAERGSILDRNGKLLAVQTTLYNIAITRSAITDKALFAQLLSPAVNMSEEELLERLNVTAGNFFYLKKKIYILNPVSSELSYKQEIMGMKPVILNGDFSLIS